MEREHACGPLERISWRNSNDRVWIYSQAESEALGGSELVSAMFGAIPIPYNVHGEVHLRSKRMHS